MAVFVIGPEGTMNAADFIKKLLAKKKALREDEDAYLQDIHPGQRLMTVDAFKSQVKSEHLTDQMGHGHAVRHRKLALREIYPSAVNEIPADATHIAWCGAH